MLVRWTSKSLVTAAAAVVFAGLAAPVSAATVCDLTTLGSSCGVGYFGGGAGNAIFQQIVPQPTGTGFIDPFLRLQNSPNEQGYNTSSPSPYQFDQKNPINYTHDIQLKDVPIVTVNGVQYREFLLDINEANSANNHLLSLDQLQIFLSPDGLLNNYNSSTRKMMDGATALNPIYDLDTSNTHYNDGQSQDNWVKLNYSLASGSGSGDMRVLINASLFTGSANQFVYLYSQFGKQPNYTAGAATTADAGFEEWWVKKGSSTTVPEPTTLLLFGAGALATAYRRRSRQ